MGCTTGVVVKKYCRIACGKIECRRDGENSNSKMAGTIISIRQPPIAIPMTTSSGSTCEDGSVVDWWMVVLDDGRGVFNGVATCVLIVTLMIGDMISNGTGVDVAIGVDIGVGVGVGAYVGVGVMVGA